MSPPFPRGLAGRPNYLGHAHGPYGLQVMHSLISIANNPRNNQWEAAEKNCGT